MNPLAWLNPGRWLLYAALLGALALGSLALEKHIEGIGYAKAEKLYTDAIAKQKADAAAMLAELTKKAANDKALLDTAIAQINTTDAQNEQTLNALRAAALADSGHTGRLRDPYAAQCGPSDSSPPGQATGASSGDFADATKASGLLSKELSGLLLKLSSEADEVNRAYIACRSVLAIERTDLAQD